MKFLIVLLRFLVLPFSLLYGLITEIRNFLFDLKILPIYRSKLPVISVGNLVVGGSGKTPFTIWLAKQLSNTFKVAVVSRGYGRKSKGLKIVADEGKLLTTVDEAGDEPFLIAKKLSRATVVVAEKRKQALQWLEQTNKADLVILDDGFQHRHVWRAMDFVLFKSARPFLWNFYLPTGSWRESPWRVKRAHFIGCAKNQMLPFVAQKKQFYFSPKSHTLIDCSFRQKMPLGQLKGHSVAVVTAIAHPHDFIKTLRENGLVVEAQFTFRDHHAFTEKDLQKVVHTCKKQHLSYILCTEKDLVKICNLFYLKQSDLIESIQLLALNYELQIENSEQLLKRVKMAIDKHVI